MILSLLDHATFLALLSCSISYTTLLSLNSINLKVAQKQLQTQQSTQKSKSYCKQGILRASFMICWFSAKPGRNSEGIWNGWLLEVPISILKRELSFRFCLLVRWYQFTGLSNALQSTSSSSIMTKLKDTSEVQPQTQSSSWWMCLSWICCIQTEILMGRQGQEESCIWEVQGYLLDTSATLRKQGLWRIKMVGSIQEIWQKYCRIVGRWE